MMSDSLNHTRPGRCFVLRKGGLLADVSAWATVTLAEYRAQSGGARWDARPAAHA